MKFRPYLGVKRFVKSVRPKWITWTPGGDNLRRQEVRRFRRQEVLLGLVPDVLLRKKHTIKINTG
jgi:hypothetical protein